PSFEYLLGTDQQGRDVLANVVLGTPATVKIGLIAGVIGVGAGTVLGVLAGYAGGVSDATIRLVIDVLLTIPNLMVLVVVTSMLTGVSVEGMGLIIAALAWMWPARTVRSQVLSIRERMYLQVARLNGVSPFGIVVRELLPNLAPFVILASIGLSALGLGPQNEASLGLTIYWAIFYGALIRQLWWWFLPPIVITVVLFVGLFMMTAGLDRIANPRLRTAV
ncbi:MAG: ABC transporter permease, partial [Chloroflexi bacterium]